MKSIFSIFKRGLEKTTTKVTRTIAGMFTGIKAHGAASFDDLEVDPGGFRGAGLAADRRRHPGPV